MRGIEGQVTTMNIPDHIGTYTHEFIMQWDTDGTDEWNATRKEKLIRCKDCVHYLRDNTMVDGWCKGKRKYEIGFCDEAILK